MRYGQKYKGLLGISALSSHEEVTEVVFERGKIFDLIFNKIFLAAV